MRRCTSLEGGNPNDSGAFPWSLGDHFLRISNPQDDATRARACRNFLPEVHLRFEETTCGPSRRYHNRQLHATTLGAGSGGLASQSRARRLD